MRRTFDQIIKEENIDIKDEYNKLYDLFYHHYCLDCDDTIEEVVSDNFKKIPFHGTCLSLEDFNKQHNIRFEANPQEFNAEYLVSFCEYIYNLIYYCGDYPNYHAKLTREEFLNQILAVIELIHYKSVIKDLVTIFVPIDVVAIEVAKSELIPKETSYKILEYHHYTNKGNLNSKKAILKTFADILEPKQKELNNINTKLKTSLFYALNNFNIRHNNIDKNDTKNYCESFVNLSNQEKELIYDNTYQLCLTAFMLLDSRKSIESVDNIKKK